MSVTFKQGKDGIHVIEGSQDHGLLEDVLVNHAPAIVEAKRSEGVNLRETLVFRVAAAIDQHVTGAVADAQARIEQMKAELQAVKANCQEKLKEAEGRVSRAEAQAEQAEREAARYIPADEDEIEREAQARAIRIRNERAIEKRAQELAG